MEVPPFVGLREFVIYDDDRERSWRDAELVDQSTHSAASQDVMLVLRAPISSMRVSL
jgi:hypothetical protein